MSDVSALLATWARGYALARGYAPPRQVAEGLWMPVGLPGQHGRHVVQEADPAIIRSLAARIDRPDVYLEIAAPREHVMPLLPPGWTARERAWLMTHTLTSVESTPCPPGYALESMADGPRLRATARDSEGAVVASGTAALDGDACVFDRIGTDAAHRHRGLGSALMAALMHEAATRWARRGVLIATPGGRALYTAIGWRVESEITSVISPPAPGTFRRSTPAQPGQGRSAA